MSGGQVREQAKKAILVLGPHRSGTSALTRVLNLLGASLPRNLLAANHLNETGFWESAELIRLHDQVLAEAGIAWHDYLKIPEEFWTEGAWRRFIDPLSSILMRDFEGEELFAVKDPRLCRLLPLWAEALREIEVDAYCVIIVRHPFEVAASLSKAQLVHPSRGLLVWLRYILDAERCSRGLPRAFVSYEALIGDWAACAEAMVRILGIEWPSSLATSAASIEEFLSADLRHEVASRQKAPGDARTNEWVNRAYEVLALAVEDESFDPAPGLDDVGQRFDTAELAFAAGESDLRSLQWQYAKLASDLNAKLISATGAEAGNSLLSEELERAREDLQRAEDRLAAARGQLESILHSRSWKLTGPLRKLIEWISS